MSTHAYVSLPDWQVVYVLTTVLAVLTLATLSAFIWRFRYSELGRPFLIMTISGLCWSILVLFQAVFPPEYGRLWLNIRHIFAATCPLALFWYVLQITGLMPLVRTKPFLLLGIIPATGLLLLWTDTDHGWMVNEVSFKRTGILTYIDHISFGPYYWLFVAQAYLLSAVSFAILLASSIHATTLLRNQIMPIAIGIAAPMLANFLLLTQIVPRTYDPMPYGMALMAVMIWWATLRHKMLDLIPLARNLMVDAMFDSVLAVDGKGRVIDVNRAMTALIGLPANGVLGKALSELSIRFETVDRLPANSIQLSLLFSPDEDCTSERPVQIAGKWFVHRVIELSGRKDEVTARILVLHDVTERKLAEAERELSFLELQEALAQVRTLRGLLPICANCKQIKDKLGRWHPVEEYIRENSEADLSHGVCPDCQSRLYSNILGRERQENQPARDFSGNNLP